MNKEELLKYAKDPKYISGIHNYCDRWCERCQFTSRCLNCTLVGEQFGDLQKIDAFNEEFWQKFSKMLQGIFVMVKEMAKEEGIDVDSMDTENSYDNEEIIEENALTEIISHISKKYLKSVDDWFGSKEYLFHEKEDEMTKIRLMSSRKNPAQEVVDINDAVEIIRWYQYQIHVKLDRACKSAFEELMDRDDFSKDSDGSAKVALIGIDRSIAAWKVLLACFPAQETGVVCLIELLENLENRVEKRFPCARDFVRPGFDEMEQDG